MRLRSLWGAVSVGCSTLLMALIAMPVRASVVDPFADSADTRQRIVQAAYDNLQRYAAASAPSLRFELSGFETLFPEQFDEVYWLDAITMPGGRSLSVARYERTNENTGQSRVSYEAKWERVDPHWKENPDGQRLASMHIADVVSAVRSEGSPLADALALTLFDVRVRMAGKSRTYKAAFAWVPSAEGQDAAFLVLDNVTQGVEEAAREAVPVLTDLGFLDDRPSGAPPQVNKAVCTAWSNTTNQSYSGVGYSSHITGSHNSNASFRVVCSCSSTCVSKCVASIPSASCTDSGFPSSSCHKTASALQANTVQNDNGNLSGAGCAAGYGCVMKPCLFCTCGLSVGVNVSGVTVTFSSGDAEWSGNLQYSRTCAKCT